MIINEILSPVICLFWWFLRKSQTPKNMKNYFVENILRRKTFNIESNET